MWRKSTTSAAGSPGRLAAPLVPKALECSVAVNPAQPVPFENDLARGRILLIHRVPAGSGRSSPYEKYLEADEATARPQRICDIHMQFEPKERPHGGRLWAGGEVHTPLQLGPAMKATCKVMLSLIRKVGGVPIHSSFGTFDEHSHIVFPLSFWPTLVTSSDEDWPELGENLPIIPESSSGAIFEPGSVYTFSVPDRFLDLEEWEIGNTASKAINGMSISKIFHNSDFHFAVYDTPDGTWTSNGGVAKVQHLASERRCFLDISVSNSCLRDPSEAVPSSHGADDEDLPEVPPSFQRVDDEASKTPAWGWSAEGVTGWSVAEDGDGEPDDDAMSFHSADSDIDVVAGEREKPAEGQLVPELLQEEPTEGQIASELLHKGPAEGQPAAEFFRVLWPSGITVREGLEISSPKIAHLERGKIFKVYERSTVSGVSHLRTQGGWTIEVGPQGQLLAQAEEHGSIRTGASPFGNTTGPDWALETTDWANGAGGPQSRGPRLRMCIEGFHRFRLRFRWGA